MPAISAVFTVRRVAKMLGEDEEWLHEIGLGMMPEDGACWIYDLDDDGVLAFTQDGIDNLRDLIAIHREHAARPTPDRPGP